MRFVPKSYYKLYAESWVLPHTYYVLGELRFPVFEELVKHHRLMLDPNIRKQRPVKYSTSASMLLHVINKNIHNVIRFERTFSLLPREVKQL